MDQPRASNGRIPKFFCLIVPLLSLSANACALGAEGDDDPEWAETEMPLVRPLVTVNTRDDGSGKDGMAANPSPQSNALWDSLPDPRVNVYVTSGAGHSQSCYRMKNKKGSKVRYFCRDLSTDGYNMVWEIPLSNTNVVSAGPDGTQSLTVVYKGPTMRSIDGRSSVVHGDTYEGCHYVYGTPGYFACKYLALHPSIKDYSTNRWEYWGPALHHTFVDTGNSIMCLWALYHLETDLTACLKP